MLKFPGYRLRNPDRSDSCLDYSTENNAGCNSDIGESEHVFITCFGGGIGSRNFVYDKQENVYGAFGDCVRFGGWL